MDSILTRTRETALLSDALEMRTGWLVPAGVRAGGDNSVLLAGPAHHDVVIVASEMAVAVPVVNDHTFSTRSGSPSCSPPV